MNNVYIPEALTLNITYDRDKKLHIYTLQKTQTRVEKELLHAPVDILLSGHPRHYVREVFIKTPETGAQVLVAVAVVVGVGRVVVIVVVGVNIVIIVVVAVVWLI